MESEIASGDEFSMAFKVNYISEDLLLVMVTSRLYCGGYSKSMFKAYI